MIWSHLIGNGLKAMKGPILQTATRKTSCAGEITRKSINWMSDRVAGSQHIGPIM